MNKNNFQEDMLKGRMAETLVEELLRKSGNNVYRFGYEAILQNLTQIEKSFNVDGEAGERIRAIPDFIVIDKEGNSNFLEVKFRKNGEIHENDRSRLDRIKRFWEAKILLVNCSKKPYFMISKPPYFNDNGNFELKPLIDQECWHIDPKVYENFEMLVEKYLSQALVNKKSD